MTTLIYATDRKLALELITRARELDDHVVAGLATDDAGDAEELIHHGADEVVAVESPHLATYTAETVTDALAAIVEDVDPDLVLVPATRSGKEVAPRVAARLGLACVTSASDVRATDDGWECDRSYLGGKTVATEVARTATVIVTVPPHGSEVTPADTSRSGDVRTLEAEVREPQVEVLGRKEREDEGVNLEEADVIVAAGRGFKDKSDLELAETLTGLLGGSLGCSRPLATDLGWLTDEHWIGLSGKQVAPRLYFAVGISGQIQHTTGIRGSEVIVAVNTDKNAPIFKQCDYGIVGDLYDVLPALTKALKSELGS